MMRAKKQIEIAKNVQAIALKPFGENLSLLLTITLLCSMADFVFWVKYNDIVFALYMVLHGLLMSYAIVLLLGLLKGIFFQMCYFIIICLGIINLCIDIGVHTIMHFGFTSDLVAVFLSTNGTETWEFMKMYVNSEMIALVLLFLSIIGFTHWFVRHKTPPFSKTFKLCCLGVVIVSSIVIFGRKSANWPGVFLMKIHTFAQYEPTPNLNNYRKNHDLNISTTPKEVVVIIGESLNKEFMSLYGYKRKTTPSLDTLYDNQNLIVFDSVRSSGIGTVPAFKFMMTSLRQSDDINTWLFEDFLMDIVDDAGYDTMWISNQAESGIHDNVVARFAALADSVCFCGTRFMGPAKRDFDEVLLAPIKNRMEQQVVPPKFTVIHLSGNHEKFSERYPNNFAIFSPQDYVEYPENQRKTRSEYDNSVLYNDWVVSQIIDLHKKQEAVVFYFPDHSLDIYHSDEKYAGHARPTISASVEAGTNIPFVVYLSDIYKANFPEATSRIQNAKHKKYETEDIMYSILDVMGISFKDDNAVQSYSLFANI